MLWWETISTNVRFCPTNVYLPVYLPAAGLVWFLPVYLKKQSMKRNTTTHKGYNELAPAHKRGNFPPDNASNKKPLAGKPKKEKPVVAEKKMRDKR